MSKSTRLVPPRVRLWIHHLRPTVVTSNQFLNRSPNCWSPSKELEKKSRPEIENFISNITTPIAAPLRKMSLNVTGCADNSLSHYFWLGGQYFRCTFCGLRMGWGEARDWKWNSWPLTFFFLSLFFFSPQTAHHDRDAVFSFSLFCVLSGGA